MEASHVLRVCGMTLLAWPCTCRGQAIFTRNLVRTKTLITQVVVMRLLPLQRLILFKPHKPH